MNFSFLFLVGWEKSQSCCELGTKSCLQLQLAPSGFVLPFCLLLFLIWSFRIFSEEPLARFLSTPSPGFQSWVLQFPLMCLQVTKLEAAQLFWKLGHVFVSALELNAAVVLCGWAFLLFLTWEGTVCKFRLCTHQGCKLSVSLGSLVLLGFGGC